MSPLAVDGLTPESPETSIREAISKSIAQCMNEQTDAQTDDKQKYCAGKAYGIAREKTGKELNYGQ